MRYIAIAFLLLPLNGFSQADPFSNKVLTPQEMQEDFSYLRNIFEETHPGLYRYTSKHIMQAKLDSVKSLLGIERSFYDFYRILSHLISDIRCAHTHLVPTKNFNAFYNNQIKTFPLMIFFTEGAYYVTVNGTNDTFIKPGFELLSINGKSMDSIRNEIQRGLWADGYNETGKNKALSDGYFPLFYYLLIEQSERFVLKMKDLENKEIERSIPAQYQEETKRLIKSNPVNKEILAIYGPKNKLENKKGWRFTITKKENIGIIRINAFGGGRNEEEARQKMKNFMDDCMKKLHKQKVNDLIIDLRNNSGGWDIQGVELFTYFMALPTRCYKRLHALTDSSEFFSLSDLSAEDLGQVKKELQKEADGTFSIMEEFSEQLQIQQPKNNRFAGKVYVLANGGSASACAEFIAYARSNKAITVIGEETGGAYQGGNGGSFLNFELPNSKIKIGSPLLSYDNNVSPHAVPGRGLFPDYPVDQKMSDLLKGNDTQFNYTLELIRKMRK
jgi:hypothetical protein